MKKNNPMKVMILVMACILFILSGCQGDTSLELVSHDQVVMETDLQTHDSKDDDHEEPKEKEGFILTDSGHWVVDRNKGKIDNYEPKYTRGVFYSQALGLTRNYNIYLPEGYHEDLELRYPVVYLLRASEGELPLYAIEAYEKLFNEDKIGPMIMVFPNTGKGIAVNYLQPSPAYWKSQFEDYFIDDLMPHIDENYRTIDSKYARAIDGFSIGGFSALFLALKHVDLFSSVGSFDGTLTYVDHSGFFSRYDRNAFGFPLDKEHYSKNNPSNLMRDGDPLELKTLDYYIQASASNLDMNRTFIGLMEDQDIKNGLDGYILSNSDHTYFDMGRHLEITLPLHYGGFDLNE